MTHPLKTLPSIAVCMAVFNGVQWLPEQLQSILDQVDVSVTVFVSVDSSTDGSESWVNSAAQRDARVFVLSHGSHFGGAARNFFRLMRDVDFSEFDYVSFADQDDIWLSDKLIRAHEKLTVLAVDAYSSNVIAFWPDGRQRVIKKSQPQVQWDFLFEAAGPGCTYVMRRSLACAIQSVVINRWSDIQEVGLHDWFVYAFARSNGYQWFIDDYAGMRYRQHGQNQVGVNAGPRALYFRVKKVIGGWGLRQSVRIASLVGLGADPFVVSWRDGSRTGLWRLALHAGKCRRALGDKLIFVFSCLTLSLTKGLTW